MSTAIWREQTRRATTFLLGILRAHCIQCSEMMAAWLHGFMAAWDETGLVIGGPAAFPQTGPMFLACQRERRRFYSRPADRSTDRWWGGQKQCPPHSTSISKRLLAGLLLGGHDWTRWCSRAVCACRSRAPRVLERGALGYASPVQLLFATGTRAAFTAPLA